MAGDKAHKLARRLQLACDPCRASKLKCDRGLPRCEQCYKRSRESACRYTEKGLRYNASAQAAESLKEKLERLEKLVHGLSSGHRHEARTPSKASAQGERSPQLDTRPDSACVEAKRHPGEPILDDSVPAVDIYFCQPQYVTHDVLLNSLPQRSSMDKFVAAWFNLMYPVRGDYVMYEAFWQNPQTVSPTCLALVLVVSGLGAEISAQVQNDAAIQTQAGLLRKLTSQALVLAGPTRPQPWLIESLILYTVGLMFHQHEVTTHVWQLMGLAIRLCLLAGYHRDPSRYSNFSPFACEMRRRVWTVICEIEVAVSSALGMTSSLNHTLCDTLPPSNLAETDFSPTHCSETRPYQECSLVQTETCFARLQRIFGDIVTASHAVLAPNRAEVETMKQRLDQVRNDLPERLKMKPLHQSFIDSPTDIIDRLRFEFVYQKALCTLYQRSLGDDSTEADRQRCLSAAETIVRHCISMLQSAQQGGQLAPLKILLMRHVHDFIFAATLICSQMNVMQSLNNNHLLDNDVHHVILQGCQMWNMPSLRSQRAKMALNVIALQLQGSLSGDLTQMTPSDASDVPCESYHALTPLDSHCGAGIRVELHCGQKTSEKCDSNETILYSSVAGSDLSLPDGEATDWLWSTATEIYGTSVAGISRIHSIADVR